MLVYENTITIAGVLGKDAMTIKTKTGTSMVKLSIATNSKGRGDDGFETTWHTATLWGKTADDAIDWQKGDNVYVKGKRVNVEYTNKAGQEIKGDDISAFQAFLIYSKRQPKATTLQETKLPDFDARPTSSDSSFDEMIPF